MFGCRITNYRLQGEIVSAPLLAHYNRQNQIIMKLRASAISSFFTVLLLVASIPVIESKKAFQPTPFVSIKSTSKEINAKLESPRTSEVPSQVKRIRGGAVDSNLVNCLAGSVVCGLIEHAVKKGLAKANINFPSSLGGCVFLFFFLLIADAINPSAANAMYEALAPAAAFLAKWMAPLFVPGLVMLPLSPSVGGGIEVSASGKNLEEIGPLFCIASNLLSFYCRF